MIVGIGTDIVRIDRIRRSIERHPDHFVDHIFTSEEQREAALRSDFSTYYAGRWSAKEALSKALGSGIGEKCGWLDISILNNEAGCPCMVLNGRAAETANKMGVPKIHVSISHETEYACATVILEA